MNNDLLIFKVADRNRLCELLVIKQCAQIMSGEEYLQVWINILVCQQCLIFGEFGGHIECYN